MSLADILDTRDPATVANPYDIYRQLRAHRDLVWSDRLGLWLAPTHETANATLRNKSLGRLYKAQEPFDEWEIFNWLHSDSILDSEPPKHTRLRSLVQKAFTPGRIAALEPNIKDICERLLDDAEAKLASSGSFDILADYAEPLPVLVIADLLGVPREMANDLRRWSQDIVKMYEYGRTREQELAAQKAGLEFSSYIADLAAKRKVDPQQDLITALVEVEEQGEKLNEHELIAMCVLLLNAGHEASVNGFGNGMVAMFRNADQLELMKSSPRELTETALEEMMRFDSPLHMFERTATTETVIGETTVLAGQKVVAMLGSANRDEEIFDNTDRFDITRKHNPHIAFGAGIHFCIGAPLARLEMQNSLPMMFERFPNLQLAGTPVQRPTFVLRGWEMIPANNG
jgi:cytochrome P450